VKANEVNSTNPMGEGPTLAALLPASVLKQARAELSLEKLKGKSEAVAASLASVLAATHKATGKRLDVGDLIQAVMREAYAESSKDLQFYAQKVHFYNQLKAKVREHVMQLNQYLKLIKEWEVENKRKAADAWFKTKQREVRRDPLLVDLDKDGLEIQAAQGEGVSLTGMGNTLFGEWVGKDDGVLVMDRNQNGSVDAQDVFGDSSVTGRAAKDGFEDLAALDSNQDGIVNREDEKFADLKVWQDKDSDGQTDAGELLTMTEAGVAGVRTASQANGDSTFKQEGTFKSVRAVELEVEMNKFPPSVRCKASLDMMPTMDGTIPDFQVAGAAFDTEDGVYTEIKAWDEKLKTIGDDSQLANVDLQKVMQKQQQTLQSMSNISKLLHDMAMGIIRKIGG